MPRISKGEIEFRRALDRRGLWYRTQYPVVFSNGAPGFRCVDFLLRVQDPRKRKQWIAVEIDGGDHDTNGGRASSRKIDRAFARSGYHVVRFTEAHVVKFPHRIAGSLIRTWSPLKRAEADRRARVAIRQIGKHLPKRNKGASE